MARAHHEWRELTGLAPLYNLKAWRAAVCAVQIATHVSITDWELLEWNEVRGVLGPWVVALAAERKRNGANRVDSPDSPDKIKKDVSDPEVDKLIQRFREEEQKPKGEQKHPIDIAREIVGRWGGGETDAQNLARERRRTLAKQRGNA